jgi:hypothetical protein
MRKWLLATLVAVTMAAGLVAYQPAPPKAEALNDYCVLHPESPILSYATKTIWGFVDWSCTRRPAGQQVWVQLQRFWTSDQTWHNQGAPTTFTTPTSGETYADTTKCYYNTAETRRWRTHTWSLHWFTDGGNVSSGNFYSTSVYLPCFS